MARRFSGKRLVVASHNPGKVREIGDLLAAYNIEIVAAGDLGLPEPEETGSSFAENARIKALASARASGMAALSDDSGLVVPALDGAPGIYSARWAGAEKDFTIAMQRLEKALGDKDGDASFICALAIAWPDGHVEIFEGRVDGDLVFPPRGERGFGYDPVFRPKGHTITFGEMDPEKKHAMSHRAHAFARMTDACFERDC